MQAPGEAAIACLTASIDVVGCSTGLVTCGLVAVPPVVPVNVPDVPVAGEPVVPVPVVPVPELATGPALFLGGVGGMTGVCSFSQATPPPPAMITRTATRPSQSP